MQACFQAYREMGDGSQFDWSAPNYGMPTWWDGFSTCAGEAFFTSAGVAICLAFFLVFVVRIYHRLALVAFLSLVGFAILFVALIAVYIRTNA
jgi:hypothetical protein